MSCGKRLPTSCSPALAGLGGPGDHPEPCAARERRLVSRGLLSSGMALSGPECVCGSRRTTAPGERHDLPDVPPVFGITVFTGMVSRRRRPCAQRGLTYEANARISRVTKKLRADATAAATAALVATLTRIRGSADVCSLATSGTTRRPEL